MKINIILLTVLCALISCAHHRDVRPGASGIHNVAVVAETPEEGSRDAISQANHFCKEQGKYAAIVEENQKYSGDMDESTYKNAKRGAKIAQAAGSAAWVFGNKGASDAGGVVGLGGGIADQAIGKGYTVRMQFKCQ